MEVRIGNKLVGDGQPVYVLAEIGINHNGQLQLAKALVKSAIAAGCQGVKLQKRTVHAVYSEEELANPRESVYGKTNGDLKSGLELDTWEFGHLRGSCTGADIALFASCWDEKSVDFADLFGIPAYKIASASLTDDNLLRHTRATGKPIILSTGMSTLQQIDHAVEVLGTQDLIILHCTSTYPGTAEEANLACIPKLRERYGVPIGYSGHEDPALGNAITVAAVALGACMVERHITLDRNLWGSDQKASLEPEELKQLVQAIRTVESAIGDGAKRVFESERPCIEKLRRVDSQCELVN